MTKLYSLNVFLPDAWSTAGVIKQLEYCTYPPKTDSGARAAARGAVVYIAPVLRLTEVPHMVKHDNVYSIVHLGPFGLIPDHAGPPSSGLIPEAGSLLQSSANTKYHGAARSTHSMRVQKAPAVAGPPPPALRHLDISVQVHVSRLVSLEPAVF